MCSFGPLLAIRPQQKAFNVNWWRIMQRITEVQRVDRVARGHDGQVDDASIGELFRRLATDSSHLVQQQFELAKTELKETGQQVTQTATRIGIGVAMALPGVFALTAFLVIALGDLIDNYAISALIVGVVLSAVGSVMVRQAVAAVRKRDLGLRDTAETLREDARWAKEEIKSFKRELTA
ncbi:MAG TPA: phage holin family protein [Gemmatimonadaceae bacterium]|nr:phage holin family protein [Gemmatimonadaceae bacterium]